MTSDEIEAKAKELYLSKYGSIGGRWELVETKEVWRERAQPRQRRSTQVPVRQDADGEGPVSAAGR